MIKSTIKSFFIYFCVTFFNFNYNYAQTYVTVQVSGYNQDIIANGAGGVDRAFNTTTATFDDVSAQGDNVLYSKDFRGNKNLNVAPPLGLPINGIINSEHLKGAIYQLESYDSLNALVIRNQGGTGRLKLKTPGVFSRIGFLAASADGQSIFDIKLNFSDNSSLTVKDTVRDWYNGPNFAVDSVGRVFRTNFGHAADSFDRDGLLIRLYDDTLSIAKPFDTKILTSIDITKTSTTGRTAIFAIIGITPINAPSSPVATQATNKTVSSFTANWNVVGAATKYFIDVSTDRNFVTNLPNYNNFDVGNTLSLNITGLPGGQPYYYRIRAANISGVSPSSNIIGVALEQCPLGNVNVSTQEEVDNFKILYPNCTIINGSLNIQNSSNITDLNGFSNLTNVISHINIINNTALTNLSSLKSIKQAARIYISGNPLLFEVNSFESLEFVDLIEIASNSKLQYISGFSKVSLIYEIHILDNPELTDINVNFQNNFLHVINIKKNNKIYAINNIAGIAKDIRVYLNIEDNALLNNINSLNGLTNIKEIIIKDNAALDNVNGLSNVITVDGAITIQNNDKLNDISGLRNILPSTIKGNGLIIQDNSNLSLCNLPNFCTYLQGSGARSISGNLGDCLNELTVVNICKAISAPRALDATNITSTSFTANWEAVNGATKYFIDATPDPNFLTLPVDNFDVGSALSLTIPGATPNSTYYYRVRASNNFGTSPNSNVISVTTLNVAPNRPTSLPATNISAVGFTANWQANANTTGYFIDVSTNATFSSFVGNYNDQPVGTQLNVFVSGLTNNTTYYYRIRAGNNIGQSPNSDVITVTTSNVAPIAPNAKSATNIASTSFTANWDPVGNATEYIIDVSSNSNFSSFVAGYNNLSVGNVQNLNITGLTINTTYYYRIRAKNAVGTSPNSNVITVATTNAAPLAPAAAQATNISATGFTANWNMVSNASEYIIDVSTNFNFSSFVAGYFDRSAGTALNIDVTGLISNTTYYYRIRARNAVGTSPNSSIISLTTLADMSKPIPIGLTGFNHDIIANGSGSNQANASTTTDFGTYTLYSKDFKGNTNPNSVPPFGLPENGKIINSTLQDFDYQLENYSGNNALILKNLGESASLTLKAFQTFSKIAILATNEGGESLVTAVANFSDGSKLETEFNVLDWFNKDNYAIKGIGRVSRSNDVFDITATSESYRLYNHEFVFNAPFDAKKLVSVNFTKSTGSGGLAIFAITGLSKDTIQDCKINIPDANFKTYLVSKSSINTNGDNEIQCTEATAFTGEIDCSNLQIKNLAGIEAFVNLSSLKCNDNLLDQIDITKNIEIKVLNCSNNQLRILNTSAHVKLTELLCFGNKLTTLNTEVNGGLQKLSCNDNLIQELDFSQNSSLFELRCHNNKLTRLNLANGINEDMVLIEAFNNPDLTCIKVDNENYSNANWVTSTFKFDPQHVFKEDCNPCDNGAKEIISNFLVTANACVGDTIQFIDFSQIELDSSSVFAWDFGNGDTSFDRDPLYSFTQDGNYVVSLTIRNKNCKDIVMRKEISIKNCIVSQDPLRFSAIAYPVPSQGEITLKIKLVEPGPVKMRLYDSNGILILEKYYEESNEVMDNFKLGDQGLYVVELAHLGGIQSFRIMVLK